MAAIRKVYADGLAAATTEDDPADLFSAYGSVVEVSVALDRTRHKPRAFGFVTVARCEGARAAVRAPKGKTIGTGTLAVGDGGRTKSVPDRPAKTGVPAAGASHPHQATDPVVS